MACTALAVCRGEGGTGVNIITGGEDGRINVLRTQDLQPLTVIGMHLGLEVVELQGMCPGGRLHVLPLTKD